MKYIFACVSVWETVLFQITGRLQFLHVAHFLTIENVCVVSTWHSCCCFMKPSVIGCHLTWWTSLTSRQRAALMSVLFVLLFWLNTLGSLDLWRAWSYPRAGHLLSSVAVTSCAIFRVNFLFHTGFHVNVSNLNAKRLDWRNAHYHVEDWWKVCTSCCHLFHILPSVCDPGEYGSCTVVPGLALTKRVTIAKYCNSALLSYTYMYKYIYLYMYMYI